MILKEFATINIVPMNEDFGMKGNVTTAERAHLYKYHIILSRIKDALINYRLTQKQHKK